MFFKPCSENLLMLAVALFFLTLQASSQPPAGLWSSAGLSQKLGEDWEWSAKAEARWDAVFYAYDEHFLDFVLERAIGKKAYVEGAWRAGQGANAFGLATKQRASLRFGGTWDVGPVDVRFRAGYQRSFAHGRPLDSSPFPDKEVTRLRVEIRSKKGIPIEDAKLSLSGEAFWRRETGWFARNGLRFVLRSSFPLANRGRLTAGYIMEYSPAEGWWSGIRCGYSFKLPSLKLGSFSRRASAE